MINIMLNLVNSLWILDILKKICLFFDWLIYSVAIWFFNAFYEIAEMDMTLGGTVPTLTVIIERVKLFIGIFALFILVKTLITYLTDPEKVIEPSKKIVINIFVSIALLVVSPTIFDLMNDFQKSIIRYNTLPRLLLGPNVSEGFDENAGKTFMGNMFTLFFYCDGCGQNTTTEQAINNVKNGGSILSLFNYTNNTGVYYEYPVISGIVGMVMIYYFIVFALALGIRIFKLFFLQILAPIPIIAYIDPNKKSFCDKYFTIFINTYIEIFVRLFTVLMAYNLGQMILNALSTTGGDKSFLVKLLLIIALFQFAKIFPKLVSDLFGVKTSLSELKGWGALPGAVFGTGAGLATGLVSAKMGHLSGRDFASHALSSTFKGGMAGYKGGQKGIMDFGSSMAGVATGGFVAANQIYNSGGFGNYVKGRLLNKFGAGEYIKNENERLSDALTNATQTKEKYEDYRGRLSTLKSEAQRLYDARHNGGLAGNVDYQAQLALRKFAAERLAQNADDSDAREMFASANSKINSLEHDYRRDVSNFYDSALNGTDTSLEATTLRSISDKISKEIKDADQSINLSTYDGINNAETILDNSIVVADHNVDVAQKALKEFKDKNLYKYTTFDAGKDNKYKSKNSSKKSSQSGSEQGNSSGGGQQGQGQTGSGQQNPNSSGQAIKNPPRGPVIYTDQNGEKRTTSGIIISTEGDFQKFMRDRHK